MDFAPVLAQLRLEREMIEQAIQSLEKLAATHRARSGSGDNEPALPRKRGRPKGSKNKSATMANGANHA
jgi:hypothetical protein